MAALRKIPSREELQKLIEETEAIDLNGYTDRSVANLEAALQIAKAVAGDETADNQTIAKVICEPGSSCSKFGEGGDAEAQPEAG